MRLAGFSDISNTCTVLNLVGTNAIIFFGKTHEGLDYLDIDNINTYKQCVPAASTNVRSQKNKPSCIIRTFCLTFEIDVTALTDCYGHICY